MDKQEVMRRLVLIKYLYTVGSDQSKKSKPYSWTAVLTLHDAVELFLELTAEYLNISEKKLKEIGFASYWDIINPKLKEKNTPDLGYRIQMEKLNGARVAFKHHGTEPSTEAINAAAINVRDFFQESAQSIYGINFTDISLVELVVVEKAKENLKQAMKIYITDREAAMDSIAIAFNVIVDDFVDKKRDSYGHSMFDFAGLDWYGNWYRIKDELKDVRDALRDLERSIGHLNEVTKMLVLGFDIRKFLRFQILTARQIERNGKDYAIRAIERNFEGNITDDDIQFCIDFVIECALILHEADFEFKPKKHPSLADLF